ncbi:MAG: FixH family protein [Pseudomonadota bacterium]
MIHAELAPDPEATDKPLKGWHVLLIMLSFFGIMFAVNGVFLYHAIVSFPGEDVKKSYVQGLTYNDTLATRAMQAELGWSAELGLQDEGLLFRLQDATGAPLSNYAVIGEVRRNATRDADQAVIFQSLGAGEYRVEDVNLDVGQWTLRISVFDADGEQLLFNVDKTLIVS